MASIMKNAVKASAQIMPAKSQPMAGSINCDQGCNKLSSYNGR